MKIKKLGALLVSAALCAGMAAPAFAFEGEAAPVEQPVLPEVVEEDVVTITDETSGALTPEGNLTLVDDYHTDYSDGSGQQFITLVSKSGNTFYLVIDRNAKGQQTVHFMNLVDEADLLALMEEEDADAYTAEKEAAAQAEQDRLKAEEEAKKAAEEAAASGEARIACNGGHDLPILCKVFHGLSKKDEALLFAVQTGISTDLTAGERLRADIVAEDEDACAFVAATEATGATFALDGIRAEWKIYCIRSAYYIYKNYGSDIYQEALKIIVEAWWGDSDSFLSGILHGVTRFVAMYRDEYSRERLIARLSTVHPKTITKNARKDTGNTADRHMKQILEIYNGSSRSLSLPVKR